MTDDVLELFGVPVPRLLGPMLLVGSITTLAGLEMDGVSALAAAIAVSVASGEVVIPGWEPAAPQEVLWFDYTSDRAAWDRLLDLVCDGAQVERPAITYASLRGRPPFADLMARAGHLDDPTPRGYCLPIIETFY